VNRELSMVNSSIVSGESSIVNFSFYILTFDF